MRLTYVVLLLVLILFSQNAFCEKITWDLLRGLQIEEKYKNFVIPSISKVKKKKGHSPLSKELKAVLGKKISIIGYMLPLDYNQKQISEFILMPYIPSCSCVPSPPPNQLIIVKMKIPLSESPSYNPIELTGILSIQKDKDLGASFEMVGLNVSKPTTKY